MIIIEGKIVRKPSDFVAMITNLFKRSLQILSLAALVVAGAVFGYQARPVFDAALNSPHEIDSLYAAPRTMISALVANTDIPIIYPDPAPVKLVVPDSSTSKAKLAEPTDPISFQKNVTPIIPGMGVPRPVKTYRVDMSGQVIGNGTGTDKDGSI